MNARFAPIQVGKVAPAPTHIPAPRPQYLDAVRAVPDFEAMDETASWAQTYRPNLASPKAMQAEISGPNEHENYTLALKLGEAPVDVEFAVIHGEPVVQGCLVHDEWVDVDCLSRRVVDGWRGDIARRMGSDL